MGGAVPEPVNSVLTLQYPLTDHVPAKGAEIIVIIRNEQVYFFFCVILPGFKRRGDFFQNNALFFALGRDASAPEGEEAPYTYRARFSRFGQPPVRLRQQKVPAALWEDFAAFAAKIGLEGQTTALWEKPCCTLYYADGSHKRKKLDKETAAQIREYFENLTFQLLEE